MLVLCDCATGYLEAFDAAHVAEEIIEVLAQVGVSEEILTDQGSNFTLQFFCRLLLIHSILTSPYHPQTDRLVKHFNQHIEEYMYGEKSCY